MMVQVAVPGAGDRLLAALAVWSSELGRVPTSTEAKVPGAPVSFRDAHRLFGGWLPALRELEARGGRPGRYTPPSTPATTERTVRVDANRACMVTYT